MRAWFAALWFCCANLRHIAFLRQHGYGVELKIIAPERYRTLREKGYC